ncbi:MAG TPA: hypothetical protein VK137_07145 [Planctomycetaceae bacterium]|nr:hypothetical protein [Planctomycetaceae bacterium]
MPKTVTLPKRFPRREEDRRIAQFLKAIQEELMPEHANEVVAINLETGEYTLGEDDLAAWLAFKKRFPKVFCHLVRVDGGPVAKFHGFV